MKLFWILLLVPFALAASSSVVTFSAINPVTYEQVRLDSVLVQNMTRGRDTMLVGISVFELETWTRIAETAALPARFVLTPNYPNGFQGVTTFSIATPLNGMLKIEVFNILGQQLITQSRTLPAGWHTFSFDGSALANGLYFLRASGETRQQVIKMVKTGRATRGSLSIAYRGSGSHPAGAALAKSMQAELYQFTAYAKGLMNSTVERTVAENTLVQFEMVPPKPPDDFTSGWRGFNLLGFFTMEWSHDGFVEEDFQMISELGFNFVRLPLDYRIYTKTGDWFTFLEPKLAQIDQAIAWGQKYGIHVCINMHRAPGYCVNSPSTALPENQNISLWDNADARLAFAAHWRMFAERYKTVPAAALSFNLVNEPGNVTSDAYVQAVLPAIQAIRKVSPERIIISDAVDYGNGRIDALVDQNVVISPHFYNPFTLTHYKAEWVDGSGSWPVPVWPPHMVPTYFYGSGKSPWNTALTIAAQFPAGTAVTLHVLQVSTRADFRVNAGTETIFKHDFRPAAGAGEWKEVVFRPEWNIYQNVYDRDYAFTLTKGASELAFRILEGDWMTWTELRFEPPTGSAMAKVVILPGIADWGVPQAACALQPDGSLVLVKSPAGFEDKFRVNGFLQQWIDLKKAGVPVHVGEWGVYNKTPHDVTLAFMENRLLAMKTAGLGWALWNFRGSFGIMDSDRKDVVYETYRGHKLDRKMVNLLQRY
jgi:aryl-phospho-beta-D-glucosidase BglC (GH1 family)